MAKKKRLHRPKRMPSWLKLVVGVLVALFVLFFYQFLAAMFNSPLYGMIVTGGVLVLIGAIYGVKKIVRKVSKSLT